MADIDEKVNDADLEALADLASISTVDLTYSATVKKRFTTALATQVASMIEDEQGVLLAIWLVAGAVPAHWNFTRAGRVRLEKEDHEGTSVIAGSDGGPVL